VDAEFAEKIGADAYGKDAAEAVTIVRRFIGL
jgi:methanogenic corrinoid protein MtbC1